MANGDLGCGSVEEEVLLAVGDDGKGREQSGDVVVGIGIGETQLDFDLHWGREEGECGQGLHREPDAMGLGRGIFVQKQAS